MFGIDPVAVLNEPSGLRRQIREAAWQVFMADQKAFLIGDDG